MRILDTPSQAKSSKLTSKFRKEHEDGDQRKEIQRSLIPRGRGQFETVREELDGSIPTKLML